MSTSPLISIITPTFNRAKLLTEAIDSVIQQSYQEWEMIIWDDGSTDETPQLAAKYADSRIHFHRGTNHGPAFARSNALAMAIGKYVAFLDSDDRWQPRKLFRQVEVMERFPEVDVVFTNFDNLDLMTGRTTISFESNAGAISQLKVRLLGDGVKVIEQGLCEQLLQQNFILPSSVVIRRALTQSVGPFDQTLKVGEDTDYWWRCALRGARFAYLDEVLLQRRKGEDSLTSRGEVSLIENIRSLECCLRRTQELARADLVPAVRRAIGTAWESLIRLYAQQGRPWRAMIAFRYRYRYGVTPRAIVLVASSILGPMAFRIVGNRPTEQSKNTRVAPAGVPLLRQPRRRIRRFPVDKTAGMALPTNNDETFRN